MKKLAVVVGTVMSALGVAGVIAAYKKKKENE